MCEWWGIEKVLITTDDTYKHGHYMDREFTDHLGNKLNSITEMDKT